MRVAALVASVALAAVAAPARAADVVTLRMATVAPEGSAWAREIRTYARDIEGATKGAVRLKVYYSAVTGDEFEALERIKRDQLDGAIASESCMRLAPSMKVTLVVGLFQSREESGYVMTRLRPRLDAEFARSGFVYLGQANLGPEVLFTRHPVRNLTELRATRFWVWDLNEALRMQGPALGLKLVPRPIYQAARAYDQQELDGFIAVPQGALAYQWSTQAHYLQDLRMSYRSGCVFFASRAFEALPIDAQQYLKTTGSARLRARIEDIGRQHDEALLSGLFARQGLKTIPVSESFRSEFFELAREVRGNRGNQVVDEKLLQEVLSWLADYRALHHPRR
jgi:TRAP-type C4-dicarboxylate transport system substrate-binding protein